MNAENENHQQQQQIKLLFQMNETELQQAIMLYVLCDETDLIMHK